MENTTSPKLIDSHIHLFNARSLPLQGIMSNIIFLRRIARPLAWVLFKATDDFDLSLKSRVLQNEIESDEDIEDQIAAIVKDQLEREIGKALEKDNAALVKENALAIALAELDMEMNAEGNIILITENILDTFIKNYRTEIRTLANPHAAFEAAFEKSLMPGLRWALRKINNVKEEIRNYIEFGESLLKFLKLMLTNEAMIYEKAKKGYGTGTDVLLVHYMMDMKDSYDEGVPYYSFKTQTENMRQLVESSNGKLTGFTAFHPKRENALQSVKDGINAGNKGVKFYPPMGYLPYGDPDPKVRTTVAEFFDYASDKIPVFTHCTPVGFQAKKGFGLNSDPAHWRNLLKEKPKLRICFGHAGGGDPKVAGHDFHGWYSTEEQWKDDDCYARKVVELCEEYENAYCEVAYLDALLENGGAKKAHFIRNLVSNFNNPNAKYKLKDKICFGTDWHMPGMVNVQLEYYEIFKELFKDSQLKDSADKFFYENFKRFLE